MLKQDVSIFDDHGEVDPMKELDCRGLACPQPVLNTKDALDGMEGGQIKVLVDNQAAVGNVTRFAESQGCRVEKSQSGDDFVLLVTKEGPTGSRTREEPTEASAQGAPRLVVKISSQVMGGGSEELGRVLMKAFIKSLSDATLKPEALVFYNAGAYLTCEGSEHLEAISALEKSGVRILTCGTCIDYYGIKEKLKVGFVTNMFEIIETLSSADRVVSP